MKRDFDFDFPRRGFERDFPRRDFGCGCHDHDFPRRDFDFPGRGFDRGFPGRDFGYGCHDRDMDFPRRDFDFDPELFRLHKMKKKLIKRFLRDAIDAGIDIRGIDMDIRRYLFRKKMLCDRGPEMFCEGRKGKKDRKEKMEGWKRHRRAIGRTYLVGNLLNDGDVDFDPEKARKAVNFYLMKQALGEKDCPSMSKKMKRRAMIAKMLEED